MNYTSKKGFTLIELLVVISIISLLASIVLASLNSARIKARDARRIADFGQIRTALEFFYDSQGRYPETAGAPTWDGHWQNFSICLEAGTGCWAGIGDNSPIAGYVPVMAKVPQDPLDDPATLSDADPTYYYGHPAACGTGQVWRLAVYLETNNPVLTSDLDGGFYNNNNGCEDSNRGYCIGVGACPGNW